MWSFCLFVSVFIVASLSPSSIALIPPPTANCKSLIECRTHRLAPLNFSRHTRHLLRPVRPRRERGGLPALVAQTPLAPSICLQCPSPFTSHPPVPPPRACLSVLPCLTNSSFASRSARSCFFAVPSKNPQSCNAHEARHFAFRWLCNNWGCIVNLMFLWRHCTMCRPCFRKPRRVLRLQ